MSHLRKENTSRVWREVPEDSFTPTLFGFSTRRVSWCSCCKKHKPLNEFYLKPKRDRKSQNDVRSYCIECFDAQVEQARIERTLGSPSELYNIFINEEGDNYGTLFVGGEVSSAEN